MYVNRAWLVYQNTSAQDTTVGTVSLGRSTSAGTEALGQYINAYNTADAQSNWTRVDLTSQISAAFVNAGDVLILSTDGGGTDTGSAAGRVRVTVELLPYKGVS